MTRATEMTDSGSNSVELEIMFFQHLDSTLLRASI